MYPWKSVIQIDKKKHKAIFLQIAAAIINEIHEGRLKPAQRLPGTRYLANILSLNRKTVSLAYDELMAQGWIEIIPSKGSFVSKALPLVKSQPFGQTSITKNEKNEAGFTFNTNTQITEYQSRKKHQIVMDDGSPDVRLAPLKQLFREIRSIAASSYSKNLMMYSNVLGESRLRKVLSTYLQQTRGLNTTQNNIMITRGSQMAIYLIFNVLLKKEDSVIVADLNYKSADWVITSLGAKLIRIPFDEFGIQTQAIEKICQNRSIRAIYITPHHHFPTTISLAAFRRVHLLSLAEKYGFAIVEDDYDYDFHYASKPILPLASLDKKGMVCYTGSFSKLLAPSVRVGYISGPVDFIKELAKHRRIVDRQGDPLLERAIANMLEEGEIQRHLKKVVKTYKHRRDLICTLLHKHLANEINFKVPEGGMAVWVSFKRKFEEKYFFDALLAKGLLLDVDKNFLREANALRLGFASLNDDEIKKAVLIIADVLSQTP